ncbi:MAG TPA: DUF3105 domain-containing protein [Gaiellaceae bacterium]|nr:DUF3105 domain-containing protein [Gaiellaceae bacterium]
MAKKSSTPPPPRRVQAPKQRTTPRAPGAGRPRWLLPAIGAAVALVALAAILGFTLLRGDGAAAFTDAGCEVETYPSQGQDHVEELPEGFEYNSFPPTTGPHHGVPAPWGTYDEPVDPLRLVHNLEHGGVVVQYGDEVQQTEIDAILEWYRDDPNGKIVAPLPALENDIALTAWTAPETPEGQETNVGEGVVARCPRFDRDAFDAFKERYGFRGPERFPRDVLTPGA